jgi:hypothetical protein
MMSRMTATRMAMPRFVLRKGKRCVSFDCQLGLAVPVTVPGVCEVKAGSVVDVVAVVSPMRGFETGLVDMIVLVEVPT